MATEARRAQWRAANARYREAYPEAVRAAEAKHHAAHPEARRAAQAKWRAAHRDVARTRSAQCQAARPEARLSSSAQRRQRVRRAMPWLDHSLVRDIYALAKIYREAGIECHVDHTVPLRGKLVSGLHVQDNLTVLLATDNRAKSNRYTED